MKTLRKWQEAAVNAAMEAINQKPVIVAVMGAGKSIAISELAERLSRDYDVIISVPTQQLVRQQSKVVTSWTGQECGQWYANVKDLKAITVACQDSLNTMPVDNLKRIAWIADECHKTECDTVHEWVESIRPDVRVGFTATPYRADEKQSLRLFETAVYEYSAADAYRDGHVVKPILHHATKDGELDDLTLEWIAQQSGPGVCNAKSIKDAETFAHKLLDEGVQTTTVHSTLTNDEIQKRLKWLEHGKAPLRCVVYVNMLSEGWDGPYLRWMALRRNVGSRVRFAQEVGRGLRASPGKAHCDIWDPCDLWDHHSLSFEAALGDVIEDVDELAHVLKQMEQLKMTDDVLGPLQPNPETVLEPMTIKARSLSERWLNGIRVDWQMRGMIELKVKSTHWRRDGATQGQLKFVQSLGGGLAKANIPDDVLQKLRFAYVQAPKMKKGAVSDLITVMKLVGEHKSWPKGE